MRERAGPKLSRSPTDREQAIFEAGIKLGGVFHQFIGTPVAARTARGLARTIERAVALQPFVRKVRVEVRPELGPPTGTGRYGYRYLAAEMLRVEVEVSVGGSRVTARLRFREELRYPLMEIVTVSHRRSPAARRGRGRGRAGPAGTRGLSRRHRVREGES